MRFANLTCCFTGHRILPQAHTLEIARRLDATIAKLIAQGVTHFVSGGALGFDQLAAEQVLAYREAGRAVHLTFALSCPEQARNWTQTQRAHFELLVSAADEIQYISRAFASGCMQKRNQYLVAHSDICVCALLRGQSGTAQTVRYAREAGLKIINVAGAQ